MKTKKKLDKTGAVTECRICGECLPLKKLIGLQAFYNVRCVEGGLSYEDVACSATVCKRCFLILQKLIRSW